MDKQTQNSLLVSFNQTHHTINLDGTEYICLNDLVKFFPNKRIDNWMRLDSTKEFIQIVKKHLNENYDPSHVRDHNNAILVEQGKGKAQGTYAHRYVAIEFLTWLSPEFKLIVIEEWDKLKLGKFQIPEEIITKKIDERINKFQKLIDKLYVKQKDFKEESNDFMYGFEKLVKIFTEDRDRIDDTLDKYEIRIQFLEKEIRHDSGEKQKIYIMYREATDEYKIGRSHNPVARKKSFDTIDPDLKIIYTLTLNSTREASTLERFLHEKFSHKRIHGEWFKLEDKDLAFIETLIDIVKDLE